MSKERQGRAERDLNNGDKVVVVRRLVGMGAVGRGSGRDCGCCCHSYAFKTATD